MIIIPLYRDEFKDDKRFNIILSALGYPNRDDVEQIRLYIGPKHHSFMLFDKLVNAIAGGQIG